MATCSHDGDCGTENHNDAGGFCRYCDICNPCEHDGPCGTENHGDAGGYCKFCDICN
jgi:hypothetical protein